MVRSIRAGGDVRVLCVRDSPATLARLRPLLTAADLRAAAVFRHRDRRRARLLATALLRRALADATGRAPAGIRLRLRRNRRPLHRAAATERHSLSVSHAGGWVFVAIARGAAAGARIGIDVEASARTLSPALARRCAVAAPAGAPPIVAWCFAEAALKADGRGIPALGALRRRGGKLETVAPPRHEIRVRRIGSLPPGVVGALARAVRVARRVAPEEPRA